MFKFTIVFSLLFGKQKVQKEEVKIKARADLGMQKVLLNFNPNFWLHVLN